MGPKKTIWRVIHYYEFIAILLLFVIPASAQISQQTITNDITNNLPTNNINEVSAQLLRNTLNSMTSAIFQSQGLSGLTVSGTPSVGQVITATGSATANWQTPSNLITGIPSNGYIPIGNGATAIWGNTFPSSATLYFGSTSFINTYAPGFLDPSVTNLTLAAPLGNIAALFAAQSSQKILGDGFTQQIPIECISVVDTLIAPLSFNGVWCGYSQMNLLAATDPVTTGGNYGAIGHEYSINNSWTYVAVDPYSYNSAGSTHLIRVDCLSSIKCGAGFEVVNNNAIVGSAFIVGNGAIDLTRAGIGATTVGQAYSMASEQGISWFCAAATICANIYQSTNSTSFLHLGVPTNGTLEFDVNGAAAVGWNLSVYYPANDNTVALGTSALRWSAIYATTYYAGAAVAGVSCAANTVSLSTLIVTNGIVTHC